MKQQTSARKPSQPNQKKIQNRKFLIFAIASLVCTVAIAIFFLSNNNEPLEVKENKQQIRPVSIIEVTPGDFHSTITAYGESLPIWQVQLRSRVQGEVLEVFETFRVGNKIAKGTPLLQIDQTDYKVNLAQAQLGYKRAMTELLVEEREGINASDAWKRAGLKGSPASPLVLRQPYLDMTKAQMGAAEELIKQAKKQIADTTVTAPFDALIIHRHVSPGATLMEGEEIGNLYGIDTFVIGLHLGLEDWKKLPINWKGATVTLLDKTEQHQWTGTLVREGKKFERNSRLRTLFVEVENPLEQDPPLLPGTFLKARIPGRTISGLLKVPDSARTPQGLVWYIDNNNQLRSVQATPEFREAGELFFKYNKKKSVKIAINPNSSFVNGLAVTPVIKEN